jgi:isoleucyl-tRNA synthetase
MSSHLDLPSLEAEVAAQWRERDVFARSLAAREHAPRWTFHEGPPTANGRPGVHHALARTFKDVFCRYRTMRGFRVDRKAGWDCHGLPVELEVEKQLGLNTKHDVERYGGEAFTDACRNSVLTYVDEWQTLTDRLGFWLDTDHPYRTMDDSYMESVWWALSEVHRRGLLYQAHRVVPHCPRCETTLSAHELAQGYEPVADTAAFVRFPLTKSADRQRLLSDCGVADGKVALVAWTTTPWTLPANQALAVAPDLEYALVRDGDTLTVVAAERAAVDGDVLATFSGAALVDLTYRPPFEWLPAPAAGHRVLAADWVSADSGTGVVHVAPAHGAEDFALGAENGLSAATPLVADGTFDDRAGPWAGQAALDAQPDLLADLAARGLLAGTETVQHRYPHCWRCSTRLLYLAKPSWFVRMDGARQRMKEFNADVAWLPEHVRDGRFGSWLDSDVDWALGRERYWGTPLPLWQCACGRELCVSSRRQLQHLTGQEVPDLHKPHVDRLNVPCPDCGETMRRTPEVCDVWWDSGCMPFAQHGWPHTPDAEPPAPAPADFVCEGLDQTRGWFYSLLAVSALVFDQPAFRSALCLGLVLDEHGQKMSKTRGNAVDPFTMFDRHGADAVRWYFLSKTPWDGYEFSETDLRDQTAPLRTLWHVARMYDTYRQAAGLDHPDTPEPVALSDLDRWQHDRTANTASVMREALDAGDAAAAVHAFAGLVEDLSDWWLRRSRRRLWDGEKRAFAVLGSTLRTMAAVLAPLCPFLADWLWQTAGGSDSVHLADWPQPDTSNDRGLQEAMEVVRHLTVMGRAVRAREGLPLRQPLAAGTFAVADPRVRARAETLKGLLKEELNLKDARFSAQTHTTLVARPNFRALGPRLGRQVQAVKAALAEADQELLAQLQAGGSVQLNVGESTVELAPDDVVVSAEMLDGFACESDGALAVTLDLRLTDELREEGTVREVLRFLQDVRRQQGMAVDQRVAAVVDADPTTREALQKSADHVRSEVLATSLTFQPLDVADRHPLSVGWVAVTLTAVRAVGRPNGSL